MTVRNLAFGMDFSGINASPIDDVNKAMDQTIRKAGESEKGFEGMAKKLDNMGKKAQSAGKTLMKGVTAPIAAAATAGVKMGFDIEDGINKISTLADSEILPVSRIESEVRSISDASGIAQTEITEAVYGALSAGVETANVMEFVNSSVDLTRAGFTDMDTAIDATTTVMNAYGDKAFDVGKIHDIFVNTQDEGKISVDELGSSIGRVIPTASSLGINMDELGASYAILTKQGQNANLATTNMNRLFSEMSSSGSKADEIIRGVSGKSFKELIEEGANVGEVLSMVKDETDKAGLALGDVFGDNAKAAAEALASVGVDGYDEMMASMNSATGKTAENAEAMEGGWFAIEKAMNKTKNAMVDFGGLVAPTVGKVADKVSGLVDRFNDLSGPTKKAVGQAALLAAAIGPVLFVGGKLLTGVKLVGAAIAFIASPVGLAVGAAVALGGALYALWNTNEEFRENVTGIWQNLQTAIGGVVSYINTIWETHGETLTNLASGAWELISGIITGAMSVIEGAINIALGVIQGDWDTVWTGIQGIFEGVMTAIKTAWNLAKEVVGAAIKGTVDAITDKFHSAVDKAKEAWEKLKEFMSNPIKGTINAARKGAGWVKDKFTGNSHASGAYNIPYDEYPASLHKGEMVLTASASDQFRAMGGTENTIPQPQTNNSQTTNSMSTNFSPRVYINIEGDASKDNARDIERKMREVFKREQASFFNNLRLQQS